mgnify:CR=1 FL=1
MSEYLFCSDILLSDLSSCLFDFMCTKRPAFIYFPDFEHYANKERGLYFPLSKLPFPFAREAKELIKNIESFDQNEYNKKIEEAHKFFGSYEDGKASERFIEKIFKI